MYCPLVKVKYLRPYQMHKPGGIASVTPGYARSLELEKIAVIVPEDPEIERAVAPEPAHVERAVAPPLGKRRKKR